jgi:hypothetical protein
LHVGESIAMLPCSDRGRAVVVNAGQQPRGLVSCVRT